MRRFAALTAAALLSGAVLTAGAADAQAAASQIFASLRLERVDIVGHQAVRRHADLTCLSLPIDQGLTIVGFGEVRDPNLACRELAAVNGDLDALDVHPTWLSPAIDDPVWAEANGIWNQDLVSYFKRFQNRGELAKFTGAVFDF